MQVLLALTGSYFLVIGYTLGVSKDASTRVVHGVSNGIIGKRPCITPNLGCEGSFYNVAGTYKIPNYPHAYTVCGDPKRTDFFINEVFKKMFNAFRLHTRCDFIAIRLEGSPHQETYEHSITIPNILSP